MDKILAVIGLNSPAALKRFLVMALGAVAVVVSPHLEKYGIPAPTDTQLEAFAAIISLYVLQSGYKSVVEAKVAGAKAAAEVDTVAKADDVLKAAAKEEVKP